MLSRIRLILPVSVCGVIASAFFSAPYCGWVGSRPRSASPTRCCAERVAASSPGAPLSRSLSNVPADAVVAADMAEREVGRQLVEPVGRRLRNRGDRTGLQRIAASGPRRHSRSGRALRGRIADEVSSWCASRDLQTAAVARTTCGAGMVTRLGIAELRHALDRWRAGRCGCPGTATGGPGRNRRLGRPGRHGRLRAGLAAVLVRDPSRAVAPTTAQNEARF